MGGLARSRKKKQIKTAKPSKRQAGSQNAGTVYLISQPLERMLDLRGFSEVNTVSNKGRQPLLSENIKSFWAETKIERSQELLGGPHSKLCSWLPSTFESEKPGKN